MKKSQSMSKFSFARCISPRNSSSLPELNLWVKNEQQDLIYCLLPSDFFEMRFNPEIRQEVASSGHMSSIAFTQNQKVKIPNDFSQLGIN